MLDDDFRPQGLTDPGRARDHERRSRVNMRYVTPFVVAFLLVAVVSHLALAYLLAAFRAHPAYGSADIRRADTPLARTNAQTPPAPRLQASPEDELAALKRQDAEILSTYARRGDRTTGVVRIPIGRAKDLLLVRGLPHAPPLSPPRSPAGRGGDIHAR